jgi:hypothetical protein
MPLLDLPSRGSVTISPSTENFRYRLDSPYHQGLVELLSPKKLGPPGLMFSDKGGNHWNFGADLIPYVQRVCERTVGVAVLSRRPRADELWALGMHPFQKVGAHRIVEDSGHALFFEQGLGKSRPAIVSAELLKAQRVLVVCPPRVCLDFKAEIRKWLGDVTIWPTKEYKEGDYPPEDARFTVISNARLHYIAKSPAFLEWLKGVGLVVIDECQGYKDWKSARTKLLKSLLDNHLRHAVRVPMSGTPIPDTPSDLYQPMDLSFPWLFSTRDKFNIRYLQPEVNKGGFTEYKKLNGRYDDELRERVAAMSTRATKEQYSHLLPSFTLTRMEVDVSLPRGYVSPADPTEAEALREMSLLKVPKAKAAISRAAEILSDEMPQKLAVVTYHRDAAEAVSLKLAEQHPDYEVTLVWGGLSEAEFNERIARATKEGVRSILVANMSAIETGLNRLVCFSRGILAELYYRPATVSQALARFHRLTSRFPVSFDVLFCPDTLDSRIYSSLSNKLEDIDKIIGNGDADKQLQDLDKSDWQADLRADLED